ncbi:hypothetical protein ACOME3_005770 [Neoechinorhynchus agilis]
MMPTTLTHFCDQLIRFKSSVAVMSSDAKKLCCAGFTDNSIRIYNTINGRLMESVKGHTDTVNVISVDEAYNLLVSGSRDCSILVWSFNADKFSFISKIPIIILIGHHSPPVTVDVSSQHGIVISASKNEILVHDLDYNDLGCHRLSTTSYNNISDLQLTSGPYVVVVIKPRSFQNTILLLSSNSLELIRNRVIENCVDQIECDGIDRIFLAIRSQNGRAAMLILSTVMLETLASIDLEISGVVDECSFWNTPTFSTIFCLVKTMEHQCQFVLTTLNQSTTSESSVNLRTNISNPAVAMRSSRRFIRSVQDTMYDIRRSFHE